jgi:hypothetical protein
MSATSRERYAARVVGEDPDYRMVTWGPIFILIWRRNTTMAGVARLYECYGEHAKQGSCAILTVIEQGAPMPSSEVRTALAKFLSGAADTLKISAVAFEGAGFRAAAVRGVVTGLTMLARQPFPHKIFPTVDQAAQWLGTSFAQAAGHNIDASALLNALREIREQGRPS